MKRLLSALIVFALCLVAAPVSAAAGEQILDFNTDITLTNQNDANITETIVYDFGTNQRHGIYRDIPVQLHDGADTYYMTLNYGNTVDQNGKEVQAQISDSGADQRLRLGDPDVTITGVHTYKISYTLSPVVYKYNDKPFFNFDVIGTGFDVPIKKASVNVRTDPLASFSNVACFVGFEGSNNPCVMTPTAANIMQVTAADLQPYQGITLNANLPDGYMSTYLEPNQKPPPTWGEIWGVVVAFAVPVLLIGGIAIGILIAGIRYMKAKRRRDAQTVVAQYDPPKTLTPAEIGHLSDDSSDTAEVTATVIDLARRGYIKVQELAAPSGFARLFGKRQDYTLTKLKEPSNFTQAETAIFSGLFGSQSEVQLTKLDRVATSKAVLEFKKQVKKSLSEKGYYSTKGGPLTKGVLTDEGAQQWALVDGFRLYIKVVEKDRLAFTDAPAKTPKRFSELLPYAIALGVEEEWAEQFRDIDVQPETSWYNGNNSAAFSAAAFTSSLNSGFAATLASNSSVSSGGGSSGGGGGGGGGGSW